MTKGITPSRKKHVFAFPKEVTRKLWLSAIHRYADSFNPEHSGVCELHFKAEDFEANYAPRTSTARVWMRLKPKAVPSVFVKYMFKHFPRKKKVNRFVNSHFLQPFSSLIFFIVFFRDRAKDRLFSSTDS